MNAANIQSYQAGQPSAQKQAALPQQQGNLQEAVTRAFEVAQAIERAVFADTGESLEQFMTRAMTKFFERSEETRLRIGLANDINSWESGCLRVYDVAELVGTKLGLEEFGPENSYPSGHPLFLGVEVESKDEAERVLRYMEEHGFVPDTSHPLDLPGSVSSKYRDRSELDSRLLTSLVCSILKSIWRIKTKKEIVCYFDHDGESAFVNASQEALRECLALISSREPQETALSIIDKDDGPLLAFKRATHGTLQITIFDFENGLKLKSLMETAGFVCDDYKYGLRIWLGPEDADIVVPLIFEALGAVGINPKSDYLRMCLSMNPRFV